MNELDNSSYDQEGASISFNMTLNVKFTDYLNASVVGSYSTSNTDIEGWWGEKSHHVALLCSQSMEMPRQKETIRSLRYLSVESWPRIVLGIEIICYGFS